MPGVKRKAASSSDTKSSTGKRNSSSNITARYDRAEAKSGPDDFDDGNDLMAAALAGEGDEEEMPSEVGSAEEGNGNGEVEMFSDEDMEGGFEDVSGQVEEEEGMHSAKRSSNHPSLYAIPSRDEMSALKNTSELYKSNIFRLKVSGWHLPMSFYECELLTEAISSDRRDGWRSSTKVRQIRSTRLCSASN
jgi:hypothetical protein